MVIGGVLFFLSRKLMAWQKKRKETAVEKATSESPAVKPTKNWNPQEDTIRLIKQSPEDTVHILQHWLEVSNVR